MKLRHRWIVWTAMLCVFAFLVYWGVKSGDMIMIQMESSTL